MSSSLRFKLVAWLVLLTSLSLAVVGLTNFTLSRNKLLQQINEQSTTSVSNSAQNLYDFLSIRLAEVELISRVSIMKQGNQEDRLNFLTQELKTDENRYYAMAIVDLTGTLEFTTGTIISLAGERRFQQALEGKTFISDPHLSKTKGVYVISITAPIFDDEHQVISIIDVSLLADPTFQEHLLPPLDKGELLLINQNGLTLYDSDPTSILKTNIFIAYPELNPEFQRGIKKGKGYIDESFLTGQKTRWFYSRVPHLEWYLVYSMPITALEAPTSPLLWSTIGLIVMTALIIFVLIYITTNHLIIKRIKQILQVTEAVAAGDFHTKPIVFTSKDELGALALSVNGMMENLRELFEPFEAFIHHNQYAMIVLDPNYMINHLNGRAVELLGYSLREVHRRSSPLIWLDQQQVAERAAQYSIELGELIPADCTALVIRSLRHLKEDSEWTWYHKDGTRIYVQASVSCITHPNGELKGYVLIARDISDIKESNETKERLLTIVESARDTILTFDQDGYIFYINQAGIRTIGLAHTPVGRTHFSEYVEILNTIDLNEGLLTAIQLGFWEFEAEVLTKNQRRLTVSLIIVPHYPIDKGELYFSAITRDISDQVRAKEELILAKQEADEANLAKGVFLARMSHEIRTPLNGIVGLSHLLEKTSMTDLQKDYIRKISRSSRSLSHIINDILDFSKLEVDKLVIEHHPFQLDETLDRVCETLSVQLGHKPVDFICDIPNHVPTSLIGDSLRLYQVLLNLCSNAIKFTEIGTVTLRVQVDQQKENEVSLLFRITDTGIGMDEQQLAILFQPFVQGDGITSRKYGGTGLGLVISKNIIENMGGTISVTSKQDEGSEFVVTLTFALNQPLSTKVLTPLPLCMLVVEDHPALNRVLVHSLQSICSDVAGVHSWKEALQVIQHVPLDMILLDMEADDMYGEDVWLTMLAACKRQGIRTIIYTSLSGRDALEQLPAAAPDAILVKPISRSLLYRTLDSLISEQGMSRNLSLQESVTKNLDKPAHSLTFSALTDTPLHILLVEDNDINQTVARSLLESMMNCHIQVAGNGYDALHDLENDTYDLILMDIHLPGLDGIETTKRIRLEPKWAHIPIIAITADSTLDNRLACMAAGMSEMISKPIIPERLRTVIEAALQSHADIVVKSLDIEEALQRIGGRTDIFREMLRKFQDQSVRLTEQLVLAIGAGNHEEALRLLHGLRGSSSNLSANRVFAAATALEEHLKERDVFQGEDAAGSSVLDHLQTLEDELQNVFQTIQKLLLD